MKHVFKYCTGHTIENGVLRNVWEEKEFNTRKALIDYLVLNKAEILEQKKSIEKHCEGGIGFLTNPNSSEIIKALGSRFQHKDDENSLVRTLVANTYWWMDSFSDVHLGRGAEGDSAVFTESIKDRVEKIYPLDQHRWSLDGKMGKTLDIFEAPISWRTLGQGKTGMTEALFAVAEIQRAKNPSRFEDYKNSEIDQHSVGMQYLDIQLAVDDEEEYPKEYAVYQKYLPKIGNRAEVEAQGFFFAVGKAKLKEYSAVLAGANELTPVISHPAGASGKADPAGASLVKDERVIRELELLKLKLKVA